MRSREGVAGEKCAFQNRLSRSTFPNSIGPCCRLRVDNELPGSYDPAQTFNAGHKSASRRSPEARFLARTTNRELSRRCQGLSFVARVVVVACPVEQARLRSIEIAQNHKGSEEA